MESCWCKEDQMENHLLKVLVYGFYQKNNLGDDFFEDAFKSLFPFVKFKFVNEIKSKDLKEYDHVFFGGGSFVYDAIQVEDFNLLLDKNIFYIGIGVEKVIHEQHQLLMRKAKLIATRSNMAIFDLLKLNQNSFIIPDIVYAIPPTTSNMKVNKILYIPNGCVVPNNKSPHWMHNSWNYFKSEFSQFLDEANLPVDILPMCDSKDNNDIAAGYEVMNLSVNKNYNLLDKPLNFKSMTYEMSKYPIVITQRFHGIILSEILGKNYINIHHHDKLRQAKPHSGSAISYYGLTKDEMSLKFNIEKNKTKNPFIISNTFEDLSFKVKSILERL